MVSTKPRCDSHAISLLALLSTKMEAHIQLYDLLYVRNINVEMLEIISKHDRAKTECLFMAETNYRPTGTNF